jgi:flavodoxin
MKIGIIVHSETGNTFSVVQKLQDSLLVKGHNVNMLRIAPKDSNETDPKKINLIEIPDVSSYDAVILAGPVRGGSVSPVLAACISKLDTLAGKKAACMVTEMFPFKWMGGNRAIKQMVLLCQMKGASVYGTGIVNWSGKNRDQRIMEVVNSLSNV